MKDALTYFDTAAPIAKPTLIERCFRTVFQVANGWTVLSGLIFFFTMDSTSIKWKVLRIVCLSISVAIYSVAWPLHRILRQHEKETQP
jgi:predicted membrane channel-forming protein YqfA (hemolysin III family)